MTDTAADSPSTTAAVEAEIQEIRALGLSELRTLWRKTFKKGISEALTRDLLVRMLCWQAQERVFGGHDRRTLKLLATYAQGRPEAPERRRLKPGTEIVREYQGERHTVVITEAGFLWRGQDHPSLTAIARAITGTAWNGPRFFGLRKAGEGRKRAGKPQIASLTPDQGKAEGEP